MNIYCSERIEHDPTPEDRRRRLFHLADVLAQRATAPRDQVDREHGDELLRLAVRALQVAEAAELPPADETATGDAP